MLIARMALLDGRSRQRYSMTYPVVVWDVLQYCMQRGLQN